MKNNDDVKVWLTALLCTALASCGENTNSSAGADSDLPNDEDFYFIGGAICDLDQNQVAGRLDENGAFIPSATLPDLIVQQSEIDCGELPRTDLTGPSISSTGHGNITIGSQVFDISGMIGGEIELPETFAHYGHDVLLHDGEYRSSLRTDGNGTIRLDWGIYNASFAVSLEIFASHSENVSDLNGKSFVFDVADDIDDPRLIDRDVFLAAILLIDDNADNVITQGDRILRVSAGQFSWLGNSPDLVLTAELEFPTSSAASISYEGDFSVVELPKTKN